MPIAEFFFFGIWLCEESRDLIHTSEIFFSLLVSSLVSSPTLYIEFRAVAVCEMCVLIAIITPSVLPLIIHRLLSQIQCDNA